MIRKSLRKLKRRVAIRLGVLIRSVEDEVDRQTLPKFANQPKNLRIESPRRISNPQCITIGDDVSLGPGCLLSATLRYPGAFMQGAPDVEPQEFEPAICIGNRVSATGHLTIGDGAVIGAKAGVHSDLRPGQRVLGSPAIDGSIAKRAMALIPRLPDLRTRIRRLEKRLDALQGKASD